MKTIILLAAVVVLSTVSCQSQLRNAKTATVPVHGNCTMCEAAIEKAATIKRLSKADWDEKTRMATITYDSVKTTLDAVLKNIALAGYDNQRFLAPDDAYNKLPDCCKYERVNKKVALISRPVQDTSSPKKDQVNHNHNGMNMAAQDSDQLSAVFDSYFSIKDALVKTDANAASGHAKKFEAAMSAVKMDKLPATVHTVWMNVMNDLKTAANQISGTRDITIQRDQFMGFSKNLYALFKVAKPANTVYYQFCPMANDGKGANWLSRESGIRNPYYGAEMLTCGKTVETIK